jgi:hypothetical protein
MAIRDQNRSRKVYSFFRIAPSQLPTQTGNTDLLIFPSIGALQAQSVTSYESGMLAFVQTIRDYFFIEKTVNTGSTDSIQTLDALNYEGVWHRMGLGGSYWKNQRTWYVNSESGDDQNLGSSDKPIKTIDELYRRLLGVTKIGSSYTINLMSVTSSITNNLGLNIELDGGSVTFQGYPQLMTDLGTITALSGAVDYSAATSGSAPYISVSGALTTAFASSSLVADNNLLYVSSSTGVSVIGWALDGFNGSGGSRMFMTPTLLSNSVGAGKKLFKSSTPVINTPGVIARGWGNLYFNSLTLGVSTSTGITIGGAEPAAITLSLSSIESQLPVVAGGSIFLDRSRIRSTSGSVLFNNQTRLYGSGSGFVLPNKNLNIRDSHVELGSSVFANCQIVTRDSRIIMSVPLASGCALLRSSTIEVQSDSVVDVRNLIMTMSISGTVAGTDSSHVTVTGQNCTVFYDSTNLPKANNITINNGYAQEFRWSDMPYQEIGTNTLVASGSLKSILNPTD